MSGFFIDASVPGVSNSLLQLGYVNAKEVPEMVSAGGGYSNTLGDIDVQGVMVEFTDLAGLGLDFFAHYGISTAKPNGHVASMPYDMNGDGDVADTGDIYPMGLLTNTSGDTEEKRGSAVWTGLRYTLPFADTIKVGYEYNKGDKNWVNFSWGANDVTNKLAARGTATEFYLVGEINRYSFLRLGMTAIDYDYTGSGNYHGAPQKISALTAMTGSATTVDKVENAYLLFNLLF
jgi:hypothetical protein